MGNEDATILKIPIVNLLTDILNIANKNPINKEVLDMLAESSKTYAELIVEKGFERGKKEGLEKGIKILIASLYKMNKDDVYIVNELMNSFDLSQQEAENWILANNQ